jgi:hypothetical protein
MDAIAILLRTALHNRIHEPNMEAGFDRLTALTREAIDYATFCEAVAQCVGAGLIKDPVRLTEGALQCHWHLELTAAGVTAARLSNSVREDH